MAGSLEPVLVPLEPVLVPLEPVLVPLEPVLVPLEPDLGSLGRVPVRSKLSIFCPIRSSLTKRLHSYAQTYDSLNPIPSCVHAPHRTHVFALSLPLLPPPGLPQNLSQGAPRGAARARR